MTKFVIETIAVTDEVAVELKVAVAVADDEHVGCATSPVIEHAVGGSQAICLDTPPMQYEPIGQIIEKPLLLQ